MPYYCTVPRCTSMAGKAKNVSFHQFPRDEELAKLWNDILKRGKPYTKYSKVCSLHFMPEDYTITSVGKNKGQWRTLRKDAVPSRNLPSNSPVPYQRQRTTSPRSTSNPTTNVIDPRMHQQIAQAIYMQTMLAMQSAGTTESTLSSEEPQNEEEEAHTSSDNQSQENESIPLLNEFKTSYKCSECSKCFKDPDVFTLHQRTHSKNNEKENYNTNAEDTLKSNPILANLLKNRSNIELPNNNIILENQIMFLAANMENYIKNLIISQSIHNSQNNSDCDKSLNESSDSSGLIVDEDA